MQQRYKRALTLAPVVALVAVAGATAMPVLAQNAGGDTETHLAQAVSTMDTPSKEEAVAFAIARQAEAAEASRSAQRIALADKAKAAIAAQVALDARTAVITRAWAREKIRLKGARAAAVALHKRQAKAQLQRAKSQRAQAARRLVQKRAAQAAAKRAATRAAVKRTSTLARQGSPKAFAQSLVGSGKQYQCLVLLWNRESGWNYLAKNPSSGAYGIPQSLPGTKMASAGADWATNPQTQIRWGVSYINSRYGTPCSAWAHSESVGWY
jgi:Transglycosylase SLT domain